MKKIFLLVSLFLISCGKAKNSRSEIQDIGFANPCSFDKVPNPNHINFFEKAKAVVKIVDDTGSGSGYFINKKGTIVTAYHVIKDCRYNISKCSVEVPVAVSCMNGQVKTKFQTFKNVKILWPVFKPYKARDKLQDDVGVLQIDLDEHHWKENAYLEFSDNIAEQKLNFNLGYPYQQDYKSLQKDYELENKRLMYFEYNLKTLKAIRNLSDIQKKETQKFLSQNATLFEEHEKKLENLLKQINCPIEMKPFAEEKVKLYRYFKDQFQTLLNPKASLELKSQVLNELKMSNTLFRGESKAIANKMYNLVEKWNSINNRNYSPQKTLSISFGNFIDKSKLYNSSNVIFTDEQKKILQDVLTYKTLPKIVEQKNLIDKLIQINLLTAGDSKHFDFTAAALSQLYYSDRRNFPLIFKWFFYNPDFIERTKSAVPGFKTNWSSLRSELSASDAGSAPGSSGGPQLNSYGMVVGTVSSSINQNGMPEYFPNRATLAFNNEVVFRNLDALNVWNMAHLRPLVSYTIDGEQQ